MIGGIVVIVITFLFATLISSRLERKYPFLKKGILIKLYWYHLLMGVAYYIYATFNPSDSKGYYNKILVNFRGENWMDYFGTSTTFIEFLAFPLIKYFGFSYEAMMALFAFAGYVGFCLFYVLFRENTRFKNELFGYDFLMIILFLPNLHFWSSSLGKGSTIFLGLALFFFGINKIGKRFLYIIFGIVIIYFVRPHVAMLVILSSIAGFMFSSKGVSMTYRVMFLIAASGVFFYIFSDVMTMVGLDDDAANAFSLDQRAKSLTEATSGIDITNYSLVEKLFAFIYRPLFFDAPGALGIIVSFENLFYLIISLKLFSLRGFRFIWSADFMVKSAFLSFITVSLALAQISGNLGLAMRQKSQVMILFLFIILKLMDDQKYEAYLGKLRAREQHEKQKALSK